MRRKLFCEISPPTYKISVHKCILFRNIKNMFSSNNFAHKKSEELLPYVIYKHNSLIRRKLGNVDMTISSGKATHGIGGGMCQFTNLIHWMVLHTDMEIIEHHHHDQIDLIPDFNRTIPFGTGTSI